MPGETDTPGTALVTGASSGIGYELTKLFARDGYDVILVSRRRERLAAVAEELADQGITVTALCPGETDTGFFDRGDYDKSGAADGDRMSAAEVAEAGYRGLMAGDRVVIPGRLNGFRVSPATPPAAAVRQDGQAGRNRIVRGRQATRSDVRSGRSRSSAAARSYSSPVTR